MAKGKRKQRKLLAGHQRVGKRFIPPLKQIPVASSISYIDDMLPELVWLGLINDRHGYIPAARIMEQCFLSADSIATKETSGNLALLSTYTKFSDEQKDALRNRLNQVGILELLQDTIAPLTILYENCPISFLGPPNQMYAHEQLVTQIKTCVGNVIDKYNTAGIILNGTMLLSRLVTRKIFFSKDIDFPDFNAVLDSPQSDEAKHAAALLRSNALAEFGMLEVDSSWARHFWNRGIELSSCEFSIDGDTDA